MPSKTKTKSPEPFTTDELRSASKGTVVTMSDGTDWTKSTDSEHGQARWTSGGRWFTTVQVAARGAWKVAAQEELRPLADIEEDARAAGLMKPKRARKLRVVTGHELSEEELAQEADALHATEEQLAQEAAESAQKSWDAQEEQERANVAQKRAQGFVCTFSDCIHHNK